MVAHSHGGNIALRAVRLLKKVSEQNIGVITLATPFLKFSKIRSSMITWPLMCFGFIKGLAMIAAFFLFMPFYSLFLALDTFLFEDFRNPINSFAETLRNIAFFVSFFTILIGSSIWLASLAIEHWGATPGHWITSIYTLFTGDATEVGSVTTINTFLIVPASIIVPLVALGVALTEVSWEHRRELVKIRKKVFKSYSYSQPEESIKNHVLALSSVLDEALGVLSGVWFIHNWLSWLARIIIAVIIIVLVIVISYLLLMWGDWISTYEQNSWMTALLWETGFVIILISVFAFMGGITWIIAKLMNMISGSSNVGLGLSSPDYNLLLRVNAQRWPDLSQNYQSKRFNLKEILKDSSGLLFHSRLYSHPGAIKYVADWMHKELT